MCELANHNLIQLLDKPGCWQPNCYWKQMWKEGALETGLTPERSSVIVHHDEPGRERDREMGLSRRGGKENLDFRAELLLPARKAAIALSFPLR